MQRRLLIALLALASATVLVAVVALLIVGLSKSFRGPGSGSTNVYDLGTRATVSSDLKRIYYSVSGDIVEDDVSSGTIRSLTQSMQREKDPAVSPDGSKLAYVVEHSRHGEIWITSRDGSEPARLTSGDDLYPTFDVSGTRVFFIRRTWNGTAARYSMWECDLITMKERQIMEGAQAIDAAGTRLVRVQFKPEQRALCLTVVGADDESIRSIGPGASPAVYAPGDRVAYIGVADYGRSLWLSEPNQDPRKVLEVKGILGPPVFDSTGRYIVVVEIQDTNGAKVHIWDTREETEVHTTQLK